MQNYKSKFKMYILCPVPEAYTLLTTTGIFDFCIVIFIF